MDLLTLDLHVHTIHSGDSPCEVERVIETAKKSELDGIAITDHDSVAGLEEALKITESEDFLIIPGIEVSSADGHILGLGVDEAIPPNLSAGETVEKIRKNGGIAISAHPLSLSLKPFSVLNSEFDAVEVFNPRRILGNRLARKYAEENNLPMSAGSDAHFCEEIGSAGVKVNCAPQIDDILKNIKQGEASVFGRLLPPSGYLRRALLRISAYR